MQINILIVDDVEANLISLEALLESINEDYTIIKANSGMLALEYALNQNIDLIILDIQMPEMDGFEVAQLLKSNKKTRDIPVVFLTAAFKSDEWREKGFELGAVDYLTKPIDENQFINRISLYTKLIKTIELNREKDKALSQQSKMASMGEMIGNIAHQWRQPLSVISTAASGVKLEQEMGELTDARLAEMLDKINSSAQYLSQTIDDFRDFIKGETKIVEFNLCEYLEKAFLIEDGIIKNNDIILIKDIDQDIYIKNYANLFLQIIVNIINNAKDALQDIQADRYIFVTLKKVDNVAKITIRDNGGGIDKEIMPKIFDVYFTTKHQTQGTGLGLYMTYNMCKSMNGAIDVSNCNFEYNGIAYTGAEFVLTFSI